MQDKHPELWSEFRGRLCLMVEAISKELDYVRANLLEDKTTG